MPWVKTLPLRLGFWLIVALIFLVSKNEAITLEFNKRSD